MSTQQYTAAQALVVWLTKQKVLMNKEKVPLCSGGFGIFGHGNVSGLGEALYQYQESLPLWRGHNEQGMAHAAIGYAKALNRKRFMFCTSSIGPGSTNMVTAAALAHVNRLPVLFLPGDTFSTRHPDPVLQQIEPWSNATVTANDCFIPVSRYFDRITRPEQIIDALPCALHAMIHPELCGPATLAMPQDVQTHLYDYPDYFFEETVHDLPRQGVDQKQFQAFISMLRCSKRPLLVMGGGVLYSEATEALEKLLSATGIPAAETQAGKSALPWQHQSNVGAIGVTGSASANALAQESDLIIAIGSRLQDFTTGSRTLWSQANLVQVNVNSHDANKHYSLSLVGDARRFLEELLPQVEGWRIDKSWEKKAVDYKQAWTETVEKVTHIDSPRKERLRDAQVIGLLNEHGKDNDVVVCAAGSVPGEIHKLWQSKSVNDYHVEYGFSCMGYEIAAGMGVCMARPDREVIVIVGDGSYLMLNSELHASVMQGIKMIVIVLDNHGFGCINRLQQATGGAEFNNLWRDSQHLKEEVDVDFSAHAASLGCLSERVEEEKDFLEAMGRARASEKTYVIEIKTDPKYSTAEGGWWWEVAIPEISKREGMGELLKAYHAYKEKEQKI